jgi:hypothetical protein
MPGTVSVYNTTMYNLNSTIIIITITTGESWGEVS